MLTDKEIAKLRKSKDYRRATQIGLKDILSDLARSGGDTIKPSAGFVSKVIAFFLGKRVVRKEIWDASRNLMEKILNRGLNPSYNRTPAVVENLCRSRENSYIWIRFDEPRVDALFEHCKQLIMDSTFREFVKKQSTISGDKDARLNEIYDEIEALQCDSLDRAAAASLYHKSQESRANLFYKRNTDKIVQAMKKGMLGGTMGGFPPQPGEGPDVQKPGKHVDSIESMQTKELPGDVAGKKKSGQGEQVDGEK
ncbi:MAG: hypothetical protein ISS79_11590 [Phycisphaerae bacterium]|nr:hypothetical protein [Phycisphaerae bacterium]